ncbi:site-specific tyrosine recombinase XerC [Mobiluncus mulieris]|uniref:tyrosine-type recombinase/integrase n=1 Tax=Mobiluncus mulieris TaxID=2052 RepID=UPI000D973BE1|nr:tyrosine-type recombinase/integrase [Mobiluncus mulieris]SPX75637.1 site-specific tyrosine recombinase XerC [Mobiluncus mulieris]
MAPREPRVVETFCGSETPRYTPGELRQVHVFRTRQNKPLRASNLRFHFALAAAAIGETGLHIHDLRHTAASLAVSAGANVKALAQMLGHSSAAMTLDVYADLFAEDLSDVADALDGLRRRQLR